MKRLSFRRLIASLAAAVTLTAALINAAPAKATGYGSKYLQVYSMSYADDARAKAWSLRRHGFEDATVYRSSNGLYAVVAGRVPYGKEHVVGELKHWGKIPHDSFLTSGKHYVQQISLHGHQPQYRPAPKPAYKPHHKPVYQQHYTKKYSY